MSEANNWFTKNKLILNSDKTKIMIFKTNHSKIQEPEYLKINNTNQCFEGTTKFLGMVLDNIMSWEYHIESLVKKLGRISYTLRVISKYTDFQTTKMVYHANFESNLRYGIMFYGSSRDSERLFICQKRALRTILGMQVRSSCRTKFKDHKLLTVTAIYIQECILFFYKNKKLFGESEPQRRYATRTLNHNTPRHRLKMFESGAYFSCIRFFNSLPIYIKQIAKINKFKKSVYKYLVDIEPYNVDEYFRSSG